MTKKHIAVTATGIKLLDRIVLDLFEKSYDVYKLKNFKVSRIGVSINENSCATAGIILAVIGIEAYRNHLCYIEKLDPSRNAKDDIIKLIVKKEKRFPIKSFSAMMEMIFCNSQA